MGFSAGDGQVSRFLARYRLAAEYRTAVFHRYNERTARSYSALIGLFLAYSAFEQCAVVGGLAPNGHLSAERVDSLFSANGVLEGATAHRSLRPACAILATLVTRSSLRTALEAAAEGGPLVPRQLMSALRHTFAHGMLSANIGDLSPVGLARSYQHIRDELLRIQAIHIGGIMSRD